MKINRAYRYELKPNVAQRILLAKHAGCARFAYNWGLAQRIELFEVLGEFTDAIEQHRELDRLKAREFPWMCGVSRCAPQEALRDLDRAFKNYRNGLKTGRKVGYPKFRKKWVNDSFRLTGTIKVKGKRVQLPRLGVIRLKESPQMEGRILFATVKREADRWFVSLCCEVQVSDPEPVHGEIVGVDLGLTSFLVLYDSTNEAREQAPKPLAKHLKRLKKLSRRHSRKVRGSNNRRKSALRLARLHRRIRNIRQDFIHKITTDLAKTKSEIVIEGLNVRGMMRNHRVARSISDVGWGEFCRQLSYKTKWYGSVLTVVDRYYPSSKECSVCGYRMDDMPLWVREWDCPNCEAHHDRDVNAAKNLRKQARTA